MLDRRQARAAAVAGGATAGVLTVAHFAPALTTLRTVRVPLAPRLAGIGRPDHVALTFDDGPDAKSTPAFLDALDDLGWKATFFLIGEMVRAAPKLAAELVAAGHEVAVHGDRHESHFWRPLWESIDDIGRARDTIAEATGAEPEWFRPPFGSMAASCWAGARRCGLRTVLWTTWGRDWRASATPESVVRDVRKGLVPGATVLLHDSDCTSAPDSWKTTLGALPLLAELFDEQGMTVGPLRDHGL